MPMALFALLAQGCATGYTPPEDRLSDFDRGSRSKPSIRTLHSMVDILAIQGRDSECEGVIEQLIAEYPDYAPGYNELAELFMRNGLVESAIDALHTGLQIAPEDPVLNNNLGMCWAVQGDYEQALVSFREASTSNPNDTRAQANMAMALAMLGREEEATAVFKQILPKRLVRKNMELLKRAREKLTQARPDETVELSPEPPPPAETIAAVEAVLPPVAKVAQPVAGPVTTEPVTTCCDADPDCCATAGVETGAQTATDQREPEPPLTPPAATVSEPTVLAAPEATCCELECCVTTEVATPAETAQDQPGPPATAVVATPELPVPAGPELTDEAPPTPPTELIVHGPLRIQASPHLELGFAEGGQPKVALAECAQEPVWVFADDRQTRVDPGCTALFDAQGRRIAYCTTAGR
jgi:Tfp pilus assembly protein PilF